MNFADQDEIAARLERRRRRQRHDATWNVLTGFVLFVALILLGYLALLFLDPSLPFNPFPPPTLPSAAGFVATATSYVLPPTKTVTSSPTATLVPPTVTNTPEATNSPTPLPIVITSDPNTEFPYALESNPIPMSNLVFHPDGNCSWQGVAGRVVDLQGRPVEGLAVHLSGTYNGTPVDMTTLTGGAQAWYGESGFEFVLGSKPVGSSGQLILQLADQGMVAISATVQFDTYAECDKNLVLINFRQVR